MLDAQFRALIAPMLRRPALALSERAVSANQVTIAGLLLAVLSAAAIASGRPLLGMSVWLVSRLLDAVDGTLARLAPSPSTFGGLLDITLDMLAYSLMVVAFAMVHPEHQLLWLLILVGYVLCITTTAVLSSLLERADRLIPGDDRSLQFTPGLAEGGETTVAYLLFAAFPSVVTWTGWAWVLLLWATAVQRMLLARRSLHG